MTCLQHIVASKSSAKCNDMALRVKFPPAHNADMDESDPNGGPNYLRAWREYRKMSQEELADAIGTSHQVIGYLERGRTQLSAKWLRKLAPVLETTPGMLLDHNPHELSADIIDIWSAADLDQRRQIVDHARVALRKTGTE